jgi:hypothetical protein
VRFVEDHNPGVRQDSRVRSVVRLLLDPQVGEK